MSLSSLECSPAMFVVSTSSMSSPAEPHSFPALWIQLSVYLPDTWRMQPVNRNFYTKNLNKLKKLFGLNLSPSSSSSDYPQQLINVCGLSPSSYCPCLCSSHGRYNIHGGISLFRQRTLHCLQLIT